MAGERQWSLILPDTLVYLNANRRMHWAPKARAVRALREAAFMGARNAKVPHLDRARILYVVHPGPRNRVRDPGNWAPSAKAAIDGLVDARVLDDDNHRHVIGPDPRIGVQGIYRLHLEILIIDAGGE